jgi:hypothetical protein
MKGGDAYGKQALGESPAILDMLHYCVSRYNVHIARGALEMR